MEIERKYLIDKLPDDIDQYPHHLIEQGYLCTGPVVRIRRQDDAFILTYKSGGLMAREEYNLPLNEASYEHLKQKVDGHFISKTRYLIPLTDRLTIELDEFHGEFAPLLMAEVEFETEQEALDFVPPAWFKEDVTFDPAYHNSNMSQYGLPKKTI